MDSKAPLSLNHLSVWYTADHSLLSDLHWIWGQRKISHFSAITVARGVAAREMLVLPLRFLAMLLTVLLAVLAKVRAAGVAAGASWFSRHACRLLSDNRKAPKGLLL